MVRQLGSSAKLSEAIIDADSYGFRSLSYRVEGVGQRLCSVARRGSVDFGEERSLSQMMTYLLPLLDPALGRPERTDKSCSASLRFASQSLQLQSPTSLLGNSSTCKLVERAVCLSHPSFSSSVVAAVLMLVSILASLYFLI